MRILYAEDEKQLSDAICAVLKHNNYSVDAVYNGQDAYDWGSMDNYDVLVFDIMMPQMDGLEALRRLRADGITTPALLLTAKGEVEDKIEGLDAGADDYLAKPFATGELLARLRALGRRSGDFTEDILTFGNIRLNRKSFELQGPLQTQRLGNKEFQIMDRLMTNPGRPVSADDLMERIWGYDSDADTGVVWTYMSYLRKKLQAAGADVAITAVRGAGYMLEKQNG